MLPTEVDQNASIIVHIGGISLDSGGESCTVDGYTFNNMLYALDIGQSTPKPEMVQDEAERNGYTR